MFAHQIVDFSGQDGLEWREVGEPVDDGLVVVDVVAAGVSFADLLQTRGEYQFKPPLPYSPGMDATGVVRSAPAGAGFVEGQRVALVLRHGCWQEVVAVPAHEVLPLPDDATFEAGAALGLNYLTALFALTTRARAQPGELLVVHGAAGGLGTAALQVGRALGLRTIAIVSDQPKRSFALDNGANEAVLAGGWLPEVEAIAGRRSVDIVFDPVGGDRVTDSIRSLGPGGRLLITGFADGEIPTVRVNRLLLGNSSVLGAASLEYFEREPEVKAELWSRLLRLRKSGTPLDPPFRAYAFHDAKAALALIADRKAEGKVILSKRALG